MNLYDVVDKHAGLKIHQEDTINSVVNDKELFEWKF